MANEIFIKGTKEYYVVDLIDRLSTVDDLSVDATLWKYDTYDPSGTIIANQLDAGIQTMRMLCLIDTTLSAYTVQANYDLYVYMTIGLERPKIGPFKFDVVAGT